MKQKARDPLTIGQWLDETGNLQKCVKVRRFMQSRTATGRQPILCCTCLECDINEHKRKLKTNTGTSSGRFWVFSRLQLGDKFPQSDPKPNSGRLHTDTTLSKLKHMGFMSYLTTLPHTLLLTQLRQHKQQWGEVIPECCRFSQHLFRKLTDESPGNWCLIFQPQIGEFSSTHYILRFLTLCSTAN